MHMPACLGCPNPPATHVKPPSIGGCGESVLMEFTSQQNCHKRDITAKSTKTLRGHKPLGVPASRIWLLPEKPLKLRAGANPGVTDKCPRFQPPTSPPSPFLSSPQLLISGAHGEVLPHGGPNAGHCPPGSSHLGADFLGKAQFPHGAIRW